MSSKKVLIVLADGFEELEAMAPIDILRRSGVDVTIAGLKGTKISSARSVQVTTDLNLDEVSEEYDAIVFPGGLDGAENLARSEEVRKLVIKMSENGKIVAAICASPALVLAPTGILNGRKATCYPGFEKYFPADVQHSKDAVAVDENIVTSQGPGTALLFGIKLLELITDKETAATVQKTMLF